MRVIFSGGGSGGHIYPALAIYRAMQEVQPNLEELFVGTSPSMEADIYPREQVAFQAISSRGFRRKLSLDTLRTIAVAGKGVMQAGGIVSRFKPDLVVGTGGYVAGPIVLQAALHKVPTLIHEQNALPSLTNRWLSRFVSQIALSFPEAATHFPTGVPTVVTGNPIRSDILEAQREMGQKQLELDPARKTILIIQGSLGSATVNDIIVHTLPLLLQRPDWQVVFVTGQRHFDSIQSALPSDTAASPQLFVRPYLYQVADVLAASDVIIARAGGMMAEINAIGLPAIYIPSPYVADNHQEYNAKAVESHGAALMVRESDATPEVLLASLCAILDDAQAYKRMRNQALSLARPDAARQLAEIALQLVSTRKH